MYCSEISQEYEEKIVPTDNELLTVEISSYYVAGWARRTHFLFIISQLHASTSNIVWMFEVKPSFNLYYFESTGYFPTEIMLKLYFSLLSFL